MSQIIIKTFAVILCLLMVMQPRVYAAQEVIPDNSASPQYQPVIESAPNNIPVVNIVTPTSGGVSHNKYLDFNVRSEGLILNNSSTLSQTELAGYVFGNPNIQNAPARIILNEVTSSNQTRLSGYTEVAGTSAEIIIANPNGISVEGAGFLNTPHVTLSTGSPVMEAGSLDRYMVEGGVISFNGSGLNAGNVDVFDIFSRAVNVNASIHADQLNLILGRNNISVTSLETTRLAPITENPVFSLDSSLLGGMYADRIRLIGTESGVGVRIAGDMAASAGDINISNNGILEISGKMIASENISIETPGDIFIEGEIVADQNLRLLSRLSTIANSGEVISGKELQISTRFLENTGLLASAETGLFLIDDRLENLQGTIFTVGDLAITGPSSRFNGFTLLNDGGVIESWNGDIVITASQVINQSEEPVVTREDFINEGDWIQSEFEELVLFGTITIKTCPSGTICWRTQEVTTGYVESMQPYQYPQAQIISGGDLHIETDTLLNHYSLISSEKNMTLTGRVLENIGRDVVNEWSTITNRYQWYKKHTSGHLNCKWTWGWRAPLVDGPYIEVLDGVYGVLESGGSLSASFSEEIDNGKRMDGVNSREKTLLPDDFQMSSDGNVLLSSGWDSLFQGASEEQPYLIETRPEFSELSEFVNSGYLLDHLGYKPDENLKRLGDGYYESLLIRDEIIAETGRRYLASDYEDEKQQFMALMDNAIDVAPELELEVGVALKPEQIEILTHDILWVVEEEVNGQKVLVPQLYLARVHESNIFRGSQIVADGDLNLFSEGQISNAGMIKSGADIGISSKGDVINHQGYIIAEDRMGLNSGNNISISGGKIKAAELNMTSGADITLETAHQGYKHDWGHNTVIGENASVESDSGLTLQAGGSISVQGADVRGEQISLQAREDIQVLAIEDSFSSTATFKGGYEKLKMVEQVESKVNGSQVSLTAGGNIIIAASDINSTGNLDVSAGGSTLITASEELNSRDYKMKQPSGFGRKTEYSFEESTRQIGSTLNAGGQLLVKSGSAGNPEEGDGVSIRGSQLNATTEIAIVSSGSVNIDAALERNITDSFVKKSNVVRKKEARNRKEDHRLKQSDLNAGTNLIVQSDDDINLAAANMQAGDSIFLVAGKDSSGNLNMISENESTEELKYTRRSGFDLNISGDFLSVASDERHKYLTTGEKTRSTNVNAGVDVVLAAGTDINMIGAETVTGNDLIVQSGRDVNILNSTVKEGNYEEHSEEKVGIAVDIDRNSFGVFAGVQKEKDKIAGDAQLSVGSLLDAGNDLIIRSGQDINQIGSDLEASRDILLSAEGDIRSMAGEDVSSLYEYHEQLRAGFSSGIQHNLGGAQDAVESVNGSNNLLTGASRTLKAVDAVSAATQPSFNMHFGASGYESESNQVMTTARVSSIVAGRDVYVGADEDVEFSGTAAIAGSDLRVEGKNVRLLAAVSKSKAKEKNKSFKAGVTVQGSRDSGSVSFGGSGSKSEYDETIGDATPVLLQAGENIQINADRAVEMEGTQVFSAADILIKAGADLDIIAADGQYSSDFKSSQFGAEVGLGASRDGGAGLFVSANGGESELQRSHNGQINANVSAGENIEMVVGGDATVRGANLVANNIHADVNDDLLVSSVSDTGFADGKRWSAGATVSVGGASGVSGSYGETDGEKDWIESQTSIIARNDVDIEVGGHTQLDAAVIASEGGKLKLDTETFAYSDHYGIDQEESYDAGFGLNGIGGGPANQQSGAGVNDTSANWSVDGGYSNRDRRQTVRATIGEGEIIVRADEENGADSTDGLNRDVEKAYEITKDETDSYEVYASKNSLESLENYDDTLKRWQHVGLTYGRETVAAVKGVDLITEESEIAGTVVGAFDTLGTISLGAVAGRNNYGGWITQLPVLLSGDVEFYKVVALLKKVQGTKEFELLNNNPQIDEIDIYNPEQLRLLSEATKYAAINGIQNSLELAIRNGAMQTGATEFLQIYNPEHGLIGDLIESAWDTLLGGVVKSGSARNITEFYSLADQAGYSFNVASHSQGALLNYRALDGVEFESGAWRFQFFGAPVYHEDLNEAVDAANGSNKGSYANCSGDVIVPGLAYKNDPVSSILGRNADSLQEAIDGIMSFPSVIGVGASDHSNYVCQGDFCAGQQTVLKNYSNPNTRLLQ